MKTKTGQFIVTPDNGTLTLVAASVGIAEIREIDEAVNRRKNSEKFYTFHGRDVYAYTAARLAAGVITFEQVGPVLPKEVVTIPYQRAIIASRKIKGTIAILDVQYGNIWTNIPGDLFKTTDPEFGDKLQVVIYHNKDKSVRWNHALHRNLWRRGHRQTFTLPQQFITGILRVEPGKFFSSHKVYSGNEWAVEVGVN